MVDRMWVPGPLPGFNELIAAATLQGRRVAAGKGGWTDGTYARLKGEWTEAVANIARGTLKPRGGPVCVTLLILAPDRRHDPSNLRAAAVKLIEDGLVEAKIIGGDGWSYVLDGREFVDVDPEAPGVAVFLTPDRVLTREQAQEMRDAQA